MKKFRYFELYEFVYSRTALENGIDNTPTFEVVDHLAELVGSILDPLRKAWGKPISVSSGFRCASLNSKIGGSETSVHLTGYAADLQTSGKFESFVSFVIKWFKTTNTPFDQLLIETNKTTGSQWIHIGLYNNFGQQRKQIRTIEKS